MGVEPPEAAPASPSVASPAGVEGGPMIQDEYSFQGVFGLVTGRDTTFILDFFKKAFAQNQVVMHVDSEWPPRSSGFLDLYSGVKGVAQQLSEFTLNWVITYELNDGPEQDLDQDENRRVIGRLIALSVFQGWGTAPVCKSFSRAVFPPVRSREHPCGLPGLPLRTTMVEKVLQGNSSSLWLAGLAELSLLLGVWFWVENPDGSFLYLQPEWLMLEDSWKGVVGSWRLDYCRFNAPWRKRTRVFGNTALKNHVTFCSGGHQHILLHGRSKLHKKSWTLVAQPYPKMVAKTIAGALAFSSGVIESPRGGFDPSSFAFCGWKRIGEAKNPGPRGDRSLNLEEINLVESRTLELQGKIWRRFISWAGNSLTPEALDSLSRDPMMLCLSVREFGFFLFKEGKALYVLRHLVVLISKKVFGARPCLTPCLGAHR